MLRTIILCVLLSFSTSSMALEIAGVTVPDNLDTDLQLNGAGIRSKFFFKIYIAELYLEHPASNAAAVLDDTGRKLMVMHILYDEVSREKLISGWNEGFEGNLSEEQFKELSAEISQFNDLFVDVHEGEQIVLDYQAGQGTMVTIAGKKMGTVAGAAFNRALLSIWLGENPVTDSLREELLGK